MVSPGKGVLVGVRKWHHQFRRSKTVSSTSPWSLLQFLSPGSCLEFLPRFPSAMEYDLRAVRRKKHKPLLIMVFYQSSRNLKEEKGFFKYLLKIFFILVQCVITISILFTGVFLLIGLAQHFSTWFNLFEQLTH